MMQSDPKKDDLSVIKEATCKLEYTTTVVSRRISRTTVTTFD